MVERGEFHNEIIRDVCFTGTASTVASLENND